ncbi:MAG: hypothetical protein R2781_06945 [Flavobacteriaceae bacterium]
MDSIYNLDKIELHKILTEMGVANLYHANTVSTSITFLNEKNLLSRKYIEDNNLFQTKQISDANDKEFNVYDDIFLDFIDIHRVLKRANKYGPFLFLFNIDLLKSDRIKHIRITKKNPLYWRKDQSEKDWYFSDLKEFAEKYKKGNRYSDFSSMLIIKDVQGKLALRPHIKQFVIDNPNLILPFKNEKKYLLNFLSEELGKVVKENGFSDVDRGVRHKNNSLRCSCWFQYNLMRIRDMNNLKKMFHPKPKFD